MISRTKPGVARKYAAKPAKAGSRKARNLRPARPSREAPLSSLVLTNISQLITMRGVPGPRRGAQLNDIGLVRDGAVLCVGGKILAAGKAAEVIRDPWFKKHGKGIQLIDCAGQTVLPGFVDSHTHLIFAAPRLADFEARIAGATYQEIAEAGGGIRSSVAAVRGATQGELVLRARRSLDEMLRHGATTVEAKSGYGLSHLAEMKSLRSIRDAAAEWPGTVVPTLLGAHVAPAEYHASRDAYIEEVCKKMIPQAARLKLAAFVDVFCERGAFSIEECEKIFASARRHRLGRRAHIGQFSPPSLASLMQFAPSSFDHLDTCEDDQLRLLAASDVIATLLPAATFFLGGDVYPRARRMIDLGAAVALATDFNPGTSPCMSMPLLLTIACTQMNMTVAEALSAATINGAYALNLGRSKGSLEPGKDADLAIFDVADHREIPYWFGSNRWVATICQGKVIGA